jgi:hypothetical protein
MKGFSPWNTAVQETFTKYSRERSKSQAAFKGYGKVVLVKSSSSSQAFCSVISDIIITFLCVTAKFSGISWHERQFFDNQADIRFQRVRAYPRGSL